MRDRLDDQLPAAARRHDRPDLRLHARRRLQLDHRWRVRAGAALADESPRQLPVRRLRLRHDVLAGAQWRDLGRQHVRHRLRLELSHGDDLRSVGDGTLALLRAVHRRRPDPPHRLERGAELREAGLRRQRQLRPRLVPRRRHHRVLDDERWRHHLIRRLHGSRLDVCRDRRLQRRRPRRPRVPERGHTADRRVADERRDDRRVAGLQQRRRTAGYRRRSERRRHRRLRAAFRHRARAGDPERRRHQEGRGADQPGCRVAVRRQGRRQW